MLLWSEEGDLHPRLLPLTGVRRCSQAHSKTASLRRAALGTGPFLPSLEHRLTTPPGFRSGRSGMAPGECVSGWALDPNDRTHLLGPEDRLLPGCPTLTVLVSVTSVPNMAH